ncbi:hypothetical protein EMCRGX_G017433 [Ephydatia muelleri]
MQEGDAFLKSQGVEVTDDDVKTRAQKELLSEITRPEATEQSTHGNQMEQQQAGEEVPQEGEEDKEKPKVARKGTMVATAEEGKDLLGTEERQKTRGQTATIAEGEEEDSVTPPKVTRDSTMAVTAQEGGQLLGGEQLKKTRGQTAAKDQTSPPISPAKTTPTKTTPSKTTPTKTTPSRTKRTNTIVQTTEDGAHILGSSGELGRTRSQTRKLSESSEEKKPSVKRTTTMAQTAKEGSEFLERDSKRPKFQLQEDEEEKEEEAAAGQSMVASN